jgi:hypothetical protein
MIFKIYILKLKIYLKKLKVKTILKKVLSLMGYKIKIVHQNSNEIAFLHISKTAGTQIMHIIKQLKKLKINIIRHDHWVKLSDLPTNTKYFFSIRNPATRFVSGFYFRKRKKNHSQHEKITFKHFEHANDLAENLFTEGRIGVSARNAIQSIKHNAMLQVDWFQRYSYFELRPPITIIRQEHFNTDMQRLLELLNINLEISSLLSNDSDVTHKNEYKDLPRLSEKALKNLERWYLQDYMFYEMCENWLREKHHIK